MRDSREVRNKRIATEAMRLLDNIVEKNTGLSPRLIEAIARGEVTKGGLAEAGWFDLGTIADGDGPVFIAKAT